VQATFSSLLPTSFSDEKEEESVRTAALLVVLVWERRSTPFITMFFFPLYSVLQASGLNTCSFSPPYQKNPKKQRKKAPKRGGGALLIFSPGFGDENNASRSSMDKLDHLIISGFFYSKFLVDKLSEIDKVNPRMNVD